MNKTNQTADRRLPISGVLDWCDGMIRRSVDYDAGRVLENMLNDNTDPDFVRKITLTLSFRRDSNATVKVSAVSKATLAPTIPVATVVAFGADENGELGVYELQSGALPGQTAFEEDGP